MFTEQEKEEERLPFMNNELGELPRSLRLYADFKFSVVESEEKKEMVILVVAIDKELLRRVEASEMSTTMKKDEDEMMKKAVAMSLQEQ